MATVEALPPPTTYAPTPFKGGISHAACPWRTGRTAAASLPDRWRCRTTAVAAIGSSLLFLWRRRGVEGSRPAVAERSDVAPILSLFFLLFFVHLPQRKQRGDIVAVKRDTVWGVCKTKSRWEACLHCRSWRRCRGRPEPSTRVAAGRLRRYCWAVLVCQAMQSIAKRTWAGTAVGRRKQGYPTRRLKRGRAPQNRPPTPLLRAAVTDCLPQGSPPGVGNLCNPQLPPHHQLPHSSTRPRATTSPTQLTR